MRYFRVQNRFLQAEMQVAKMSLKRLALLAGLLIFLPATLAHAQTSSEPATLDQELLTPFAPDILQENQLGESNFADFKVVAQLSADGESIESGLVWRVFGTTQGSDGTMPLLAAAEGGTSLFQLAAGEYLVHAAFGRASVARRVVIGKDGGSEIFIIEAGGLKLSAMLAGQPLESRDLLFEIYSDTEDERGERTLIANNIGAGQIVRLNKGTYHVLS